MVDSNPEQCVDHFQCSVTYDFLRCINILTYLLLPLLLLDILDLAVVFQQNESCLRIGFHNILSIENKD